MLLTTLIAVLAFCFGVLVCAVMMSFIVSSSPKSREKFDSYLPVRVTWNEATNEWRLENSLRGELIQEFYNCQNFMPFFKGANKDETVFGVLAWKKVDGKAFLKEKQ